MEIPALYMEDPNHRLKPPFLDDSIFTIASPGFVIVCTDVVFINSKRRVFLLPKRAVYAARGWWTFGGRMKPGETDQVSLQRTLKRETSLVIAPERFNFVKENRYWCSKRQQEPQEVGGDYLAHVFSLEVSDEEVNIASQNLDHNEYEPVGIAEFNRPLLVRAEVWRPLIDLYDKIFPQ